MIYERDDIEGLDATILTGPMFLNIQVMRIHSQIRLLIVDLVNLDGRQIN